jgi:hypothetical protein
VQAEAQQFYVYNMGGLRRTPINGAGQGIAGDGFDFHGIRFWSLKSFFRVVFQGLLSKNARIIIVETGCQEFIVMEHSVKKAITLTAQDELVQKLPFQPYRSTAERAVRQYEPDYGGALTTQVTTPWGETLQVEAGDYLVSELNAPDDVWPVEAEIFEETYMFISPGRCVKKALTYLVPLELVADGDEDQMVTVQTMEGSVTVRAGDFYLAKGVKGEIWPIPNEKIGTMLVPLE